MQPALTGDRMLGNYYHVLLDGLNACKNAVLVSATAIGAEWLDLRLLCGRVVAVAHLGNVKANREAGATGTTEAGVTTGGGGAQGVAAETGEIGPGVEASSRHGGGRDQPDGPEGQNGEKGVFHRTRLGHIVHANRRKKGDKVSTSPSAFYTKVVCSSDPGIQVCFGLSEPPNPNYRPYHPVTFTTPPSHP